VNLKQSVKTIGEEGKEMRIIIFTQSLIKEHSLYLEVERYSDLSVKKFEKRKIPKQSGSCSAMHTQALCQDR